MVHRRVHMDHMILSLYSIQYDNMVHMVWSLFTLKYPVLSSSKFASSAQFSKIILSWNLSSLENARKLVVDLSILNQNE